MPRTYENIHTLNPNCPLPQDLLMVLHPPAYFSDLALYSGPFETLTTAEANALVEVALVVMSAVTHTPFMGTLGIYGQQNGHDLQPILHAHIGSEACIAERFLTSDAAVEKVVELVTSDTVGPNAFQPRHCSDKERPYPAYTEHYVAPGGYDFISLKTTRGRFIIVLYADDGVVESTAWHAEYDELTMWCLAQVLACMRPQDETLRKSVEEICPLLKEHGESKIVSAMAAVEQMFVNLTLPALKAWRSRQNISEVVGGEAPLFFETPRHAF